MKNYFGTMLIHCLKPQDCVHEYLTFTDVVPLFHKFCDQRVKLFSKISL